MTILDLIIYWRSFDIMIFVGKSFLVLIVVAYLLLTLNNIFANSLNVLFFLICIVIIVIVHVHKVVHDLLTVGSYLSVLVIQLYKLIEFMWMDEFWVRSLGNFFILVHIFQYFSLGKTESGWTLSKVGLFECLLRSIVSVRQVFIGLFVFSQYLVFDSGWNK